MSTDTSRGEMPEVIEGRHFSAADRPTLTPHAVFSDCSFSGLSWRNVTLNGMRFANCRFESVEFSDCQAEGVSWTGCTFSDAQWSGGSMRESQWHDGSMLDCAWRRCVLQGLTLTGVAARGMKFANVQARYLSIVTSELDTVRFEACELSDTSWMRGTVRDLDLLDCACWNLIFGQLASTRVRLHGSHGRNLRWIQCEGFGTEVRGCEFSQASWSHGQLVDSELHQTKLLTAGFERCRLQGVTFSDATLQATHFDAAELLRTRFERVSAKGLSLRLARLQQVAFQSIDLQQLDARGATLADVTFHRANCQNSRLDGQDKSSWQGAETAGSRFDDPRSRAETDWWGRKRPGIRDTGETP